MYKFTTRKPQNVAQQALGDLSSIITTTLKGVSAAADVVSDPYLPETICHIEQLSQIKKGQRVQICGQVPPGLPGGVGLEKAQMPLRAYVYAEQNTWVYPAAIAAVVGIPFLFGYLIGKG